MRKCAYRKCGKIFGIKDIPFGRYDDVMHPSVWEHYCGFFTCYISEECERKGHRFGPYYKILKEYVSDIIDADTMIERFNNTRPVIYWSMSEDVYREIESIHSGYRVGLHREEDFKQQLCAIKVRWDCKHGTGMCWKVNG